LIALFFLTVFFIAFFSHLILGITEGTGTNSLGFPYSFYCFGFQTVFYCFQQPSYPGYHRGYHQSGFSLQFFLNPFFSHRILGITEGITSLVFPYSFFKFLSSAIVSWVSQRVQVSTIWGFLTVFIAICSHRILGITEGITSLVGIKWDLFATLMLAWTIVYLIIWKGLHSSGKVRN
jgi:hypothetical protein